MGVKAWLRRLCADSSHFRAGGNLFCSCQAFCWVNSSDVTGCAIELPRAMLTSAVRGRRIPTKLQVRAEHSATLQPLSLEARHEGLSVLSNRRCSSAVFCCRTYSWFSPVRSEVGSRYASWLNAVNSL